jgi:hypothetical protein
MSFMHRFAHALALLAVLGLTASAQKPAGKSAAEKVLAADDAPVGAPLKALKELPTYKLSNLRFEAPAPKQQAVLKMHYEQATAGKLPYPPSLVLRTADGKERVLGPRQYGGNLLKDKAGDITVGLLFARVGEDTKALEAYLLFTDRRWEDEGFKPAFKVSNSAALGDIGTPQYARDWSADETKKLNDPPPTGPELNANRTTGRDTKFVGLVERTTPSLRYADPKKTPVVGFLYTLGTFEPEKGKKAGCVVHLNPSFSQRQPSFGMKREVAKEGYAVGALRVKTNTTVTAVRPVYMKVRPNGSLDPKDSYEGEWVGEAGPDDKEETLTGNGRKVIGTHVRHFGRVYAIALVLD